MTRTTCAVASRRSRKRLLKRTKGFFGDRKNHIRQSSNAVMSALAFSTTHRKLKKRDFRRLWTVRISCASKMCGISYSKLIDGLNKANIELNRKVLAELAVEDFAAFQLVAEQAKKALAA